MLMIMLTVLDIGGVYVDIFISASNAARGVMGDTQGDSDGKSIEGAEV